MESLPLNLPFPCQLCMEEPLKYFRIHQCASVLFYKSWQGSSKLAFLDLNRHISIDQILSDNNESKGAGPAPWIRHGPCKTESALWTGSFQLETRIMLTGRAKTSHQLDSEYLRGERREAAYHLEFLKKLLFIRGRIKKEETVTSEWYLKTYSALNISY